MITQPSAGLCIYFFSFNTGETDVFCDITSVSATHKSQRLIDAHTPTTSSVEKEITHILTGTRRRFSVQDCTTDPDCWLRERDWENRNICRARLKERNTMKDSKTERRSNL